MKRASSELPTKHGNFRIYAYQDKNKKEHVALVKGNVDHKESIPLRLHSECLTGDILGSLKCDCGDQLTQTFDILMHEDAGVIIYLRQEGRGIGLLNKIKAYELQEHGLDTVEANHHLGFKSDEREYSKAVHILKDLNIRSVKMITNNPSKIIGLEKHGVIVNGRISLVTDKHHHNKNYLNTKRDKLGHEL
jgi:3,4-dihydroxy 2-butanone 4-phosphate synthase / GTP cyclohydrolase II